MQVTFALFQSLEGRTVWKYKSDVGEVGLSP